MAFFFFWYERSLIHKTIFNLRKVTRHDFSCAKLCGAAILQLRIHVANGIEKMWRCGKLDSEDKQIKWLTGLLYDTNSMSHGQK